MSLPDTDPFDDYLLPDAPPEEPSRDFVLTPTIPHSREAEEAVLGSVFINPDIYDEVAEFLHASDFYIHRHRWIWEAFGVCLDFGRQIDMITVSETLDSQGQLEELGGPAYLTSLINQVPSSLNAVSYGRIVESHAVRREMLSRANTIAQLAYDESRDIESALAEYDRVTDRESLNYSSRSTTQDSDDAARELREMIMGNVPLGVPTGFPHFDKAEELGNLPEGVTLMIGDSSMGKSAWWLQVCEQVAEHMGKTALYFGLESNNKQNVLRRVGGLAGVNGKKVRSGSLSVSEQASLDGAIEQLYIGRFGGRLKFNSVATTLRDIEREVRLLRPALFVIDQINQIEDVAGDENKTVNMLRIFTGIKRIANKYGCAAGVVHAITPEESKKFFEKNEKAQAGKQQKNGIPDLNAIPWAKQIKHVTDVLLMLVPEVNQKLVGASMLKIGIWIMKDRDGNRFTPTLWEYDLPGQWFMDKGMPFGGNAQVPSSVTGYMP